MKKLIGIILSICMILSVCTVPVFAEDTIKVTVDGNFVDCAAYGQEPVAINGTTLVPLRSVFEALGATVAWDGETQSVVSFRDDLSILLFLNSNEMVVSGEVKILSVPAQSMNDRIMVPVRAIAEAFGCEVNWDGETRTVVVITESKENEYVAVSGEDSPEAVVSAMYDAMFKLDLETAMSYFRDENIAAAYFGASDVEEYLDISMGSPIVDKRMYDIIYKYMVNTMQYCTYKINSVEVDGDLAVVNSTIYSPDFDNFESNSENLTDEKNNELLMRALDKCGVSLEEMAANQDPVLAEEFEYAIMDVSFEYAVETIAQEVANGVVETTNETRKLEKINGRWLIVE